VEFPLRRSLPEARTTAAKGVRHDSAKPWRKPTGASDQRTFGDDEWTI